jgi:hypothetical protein
MPTMLSNPWRGTKLDIEAPWPCRDAAGVARLLALCPAHAPTPLHDMPALAKQAGAGRVALLAELGLETTPSGGAGLAALLAGLDLDAGARVLNILSKGPEDG